MRAVRCRIPALQTERCRWKGRHERVKATQRAAGKRGQKADVDGPGPPPTGFALLPWLLMGMGSFSNLLHGTTPNPWIGDLGLLAFNTLYVYVTFRSLDREKRTAASTRVALLLMGLVTTGLALGYGGNSRHGSEGADRAPRGGGRLADGRRVAARRLHGERGSPSTIS